MRERIDKEIEKIVDKDVTLQIQDASYKLEFEKGIPLYIRKTNLLRDQRIKGKNNHGEKVEIQNSRMINIIDEKLEVEKLLKEEAAFNVRQDKTYEDFKKQYQPHIEGQVDPNIRCADRPETAPFDPNKIRPRPKQFSSGFEEEEKAEYARLMRVKGKALLASVQASHDSRAESERKSVGSGDNQASERGSQSARLLDQLTKECYLEILNGNIIQELDNEYLLVAHPFPQIQGELLLFQQREIGENLFVYRDFSLLKRQRTPAVKPKVTSEAETQKTKLYTLEVDIEAPLSHLDWTMLSLAVTETSGLGWFQILPEKCKSSTPLQFNMMHVLPQSQIPFNKLPLDFLISQK